MKPTKVTLLALCAAALLAGGGIAVLAQDAPPKPDAGPAKPDAPRHERREGKLGGRRGGRMRERMDGRREGRKEFLAQLQFTDAQRQLFVEKARAAQPAIDAARREVAQAIVAAQDARANAAPTTDPAAPDPRAAARESVKAARTKAAEAVAPLARDVIASLTPEQRARLEGFAAARGRTLDDARLARGVSRMFARPMVLAIAEARLNRAK